MASGQCLKARKRFFAGISRLARSTGRESVPTGASSRANDDFRPGGAEWAICWGTGRGDFFGIDQYPECGGVMVIDKMQAGWARRRSERGGLSVELLVAMAL